MEFHEFGMVDDATTVCAENMWVIIAARPGDFFL